MDGIPFSIGLLGGLVRADGTALFENDVLTLEFKVKDGMVGLFRSGVKRVMVPVQVVDLVRLDLGTEDVQLVLGARSRMYLDGIPGRRKAEVKLSIGSGDVAIAELLVKAMEHRMAEVGP